MAGFMGTSVEEDLKKSVSEIREEIEETRKVMENLPVGTVYRVCDKRVKDLEAILLVKSRTTNQSKVGMMG